MCKIDRGQSQLEQAATHLRAVNHKFRKRIIEYLQENGPVDVTTIYIHFDIEQSAASQHLSILRSSGIVTSTKEGKRVIYNVNKERLEAMEKICEQLSKVNQ